MATKIQLRRGTTSDWSSANPVLSAGEIGYNTSTGQFKIGDGTTTFSSLTYFTAGGDIESVSAGAGLSGGGSSGAVTLSVDTEVVATTNNTLTMSNKTLTSPVISTIVNTGTLTLPTSTGTVALTSDLTAYAQLSGATFTGAVTGTSLTLSGDLTVNGTTTTIDTTNLNVEDKNITLAFGNNSDATADGGGITLLGTTNKTFNWVDSTDAWTSSEHLNLASGKSYYMDGTLLKDVSETLTNKTLTSPTLDGAVGTTSLTLNATAELRLADTDSSHYVGFKSPGTVSANQIWTLPSADGSANQVLKTDGSGTLSWSTPAQGAAFSELMLIGA